MKFFSSSPNSLFVVQLITFVLVAVGLFIVDYSWYYVMLSVLMFYCYTVLGIGLMLHRFYTHKSFELSPAIKWVLTTFAVLAGRGSPLGWVYIHRLHHATSDTEKDPHSPHFSTFKFIRFKPVVDSTKKINYFIIKDIMSPAQIKIDNYYLLFVLGFPIGLSLLSYNLVFYIWALPVFTVGVTQLLFNYVSHMYGYRNIDTKDRSTNNVLLWPFIMGEAWHNNHHGNPSSPTTNIRWWEIDPAGFIIRMIRK